MPKELKLITTSGDRTARLWDVNYGFERLYSFNGHSDAVKCASFRPEDKGN